jgi:hypothetical protein
MNCHTRPLRRMMSGNLKTPRAAPRIPARVCARCVPPRCGWVLSELGIEPGIVFIKRRTGSRLGRSRASRPSTPSGDLSRCAPLASLRRNPRRLAQPRRGWDDDSVPMEQTTRSTREATAGGVAWIRRLSGERRRLDVHGATNERDHTEKDATQQTRQRTPRRFSVPGRSC